MSDEWASQHYRENLFAMHANTFTVYIKSPLEISYYVILKLYLNKVEK